MINPHRLFHGVWLPQWLEERPEVSEKAKKLYAYLTYFAGGKGCAWPSLNHLAGKLHISRRYVIKLVKELSAHGLIVVTNIRVPEKGHCANHYRFLWHSWMQAAEDGNFCMMVGEEVPPLARAKCRQSIGLPREQQITSPSELNDTSPGEPESTPLVIYSSSKENNKKRINYRGKVTAASASPHRCNSVPLPGKTLSDTTKIILERRIFELRAEIVTASKRGNHDRAKQLYAELVEHQTKLGFIPDDPPAKLKTARSRSDDLTAETNWLSPEEVRTRFNELRRSLGRSIKDENL
ncbi:MAG TPA: helix-turn-helix domain-containing protein [Terrimicrobiaceae bacterium]